MILGIAGIIMGIITVCVKEPMEYFQAVFNFSFSDGKQTPLQVKYTYLATFTRTIYAIGGIIPAFMSIYMIAFKKKRTLQDMIADCYAVFAKEHHEKETKN